jgi:SAM-dependent methyltransferase
MSQPPNFNRLAGPYRWMERLSFGPFLALSRFTYLAQAKSCRHALVLGDGDGRFTARLLHPNPQIHIDAVDASPSMLKALTRRAGPNTKRLRTHQADARNWHPTIISGAPCLDFGTWDQDFDLVATHFFLDCLTTKEVLSLATRLRPTLSPTALWIVSEFAIPPNRYGRLVARPLVAALYRAFGLLTGLTIRTLPDHPAALRAAGFTLLQRHPRLAGLLVSELWTIAPSNPIQSRPKPDSKALKNVTSMLKSDLQELFDPSHPSDPPL